MSNKFESKSRSNSKAAILARTTKHVRHGRHCTFKLHCHLVFVTKYRKAVLSKSMLENLRTSFETTCADFESTLIEFDGEKDHVHLLVEYPPKVALSKLVNSLKGVSSRMLRKDFQNQIQNVYWKGVLWSPSYFAGSCGGAPLDIIKEYVQNQHRPEN